MWDLVIDLYIQGVQDYSGGHVPDGWDDPEQRESSPYLMGWWQMSNFENQTELDDRNQ